MVLDLAPVYDASITGGSLTCLGPCLDQIRMVDQIWSGGFLYWLFLQYYYLRGKKRAIAQERCLVSKRLMLKVERWKDLEARSYQKVPKQAGLTLNIKTRARKLGKVKTDRVFRRRQENLYDCDAGLLGWLLTSHSLVPRNLGVNTDFSVEDTPSFPSIFSWSFTARHCVGPTEN